MCPRPTGRRSRARVHVPCPGSRASGRCPRRGGPGPVAPYSARMSRSPLLLGTGCERERATRVGIGRICIGGSMLLTTGLGRRIFGIPVAQDNGGGLRLAARPFGIPHVAARTRALLAPQPGNDQRRLFFPPHTPPAPP